jgi:hypothetical protein
MLGNVRPGVLQSLEKTSRRTHRPTPLAFGATTRYSSGIVGPMKNIHCSPRYPAPYHRPFSEVPKSYEQRCLDPAPSVAWQLRGRRKTERANPQSSSCLRSRSARLRNLGRHYLSWAHQRYCGAASSKSSAPSKTAAGANVANSTYGYERPRLGALRAARSGRQCGLFSATRPVR